MLQYKDLLQVDLLLPFGWPDVKFSRFSLLLWLFYIYTCTHIHYLEVQLLFAFSPDWCSHLNQLLMVHHSLFSPCFLIPVLTISELIFRSEYKIKLHYLWCQAPAISNSPLKNSKSYFTGWPPGQKLSSSLHRRSQHLFTFPGSNTLPSGSEKYWEENKSVLHQWKSWGEHCRDCWGSCASRRRAKTELLLVACPMHQGRLRDLDENKPLSQQEKHGGGQNKFAFVSCYFILLTFLTLHTFYFVVLACMLMQQHQRWKFWGHSSCLFMFVWFSPLLFPWLPAFCLGWTVKHFCLFSTSSHCLRSPFSA